MRGIVITIISTRIIDKRPERNGVHFMGYTVGRRLSGRQRPGGCEAAEQQGVDWARSKVRWKVGFSPADQCGNLKNNVYGGLLSWVQVSLQLSTKIGLYIGVDPLTRFGVFR